MVSVLEVVSVFIVNVMCPIKRAVISTLFLTGKVSLLIHKEFGPNTLSNVKRLAPKIVG